MATTVDTIRPLLAAAISSIVPSYSARQSERFTYSPDQEIAPGMTFRTFDVSFGVEEEVTEPSERWYGTGVAYASDVEIRVAYGGVSEADINRFVGADGKDFSALLVRVHTSIPDMIAVSSMGPRPVSEKPEIQGEPGQYMAIFRTRIPFFASDTVVTS